MQKSLSQSESKKTKKHVNFKISSVELRNSIALIIQIKFNKILAGVNNQHILIMNSIAIKKVEKLKLGRQQLNLSEMEFSALCDKCNGHLFHKYQLEFFELNMKNDLQDELDPYCKKWQVNKLKLKEKIQNYSLHEVQELISLIELYWADPSDLIEMFGDLDD